eukprot:TRINITY_DN2318_c0_g1_i1.p1 TRINITY_DN2318_c0_g1~~TRINITY_DN2318_c0_g1_i1.p1  ORF type:complete len:1159 (+),score=247.49 TRINITY_DN2318_c0_g1_i1:386-3862(+)
MDTSGEDSGGITNRLGDGLQRDKTQYRAEDLQDLKRAMQEGTLNTDTPPPDCPCVFDWAVALPSMWKKRFTEKERAAQAWEGGAGDFFDEDIIQPASERVEGGACRRRTEGGATCLLDNWSRVARRVLRSLQGHETIRPHHHVPEKVQLALAKVGAEEAGEGVAVIFVYSYEIKCPKGKSRLTQIYSTATRCMREMGDPAWRKRLPDAAVKRHEDTIAVFAPFLWRLDRILLQLPHEAIMVFRGIDCRVADDYEMTTLVPWASHTSTSTDREVSWGFMKETAGTFFIVLAESVACVSFFSWLPDEDEWLMHTQCVLQVASKLDPSLQQMLGTTHDIVVLFQCDKRGGGVDTPRQKVENALMAARESALIFGPFLDTFVEPTVATERAAAGHAATVPLLQAFGDFMHRSAEQVAVLIGDGGTGKTSAGLRLVNEALSITVSTTPESTDGQVLPIFVSLPAVSKLLTKPHTDWSPIVHHVMLSLSLSGGAELAELQARPLLLLLDSVEEAVGRHSLLKIYTLLQMGGVRLSEWPHLRVVITVRGEILEHEQLTPTMIGGPCEVWRLQPFTTELADKYADSVARVAVRQLARAIVPLWTDDEKVARELHKLPCPPPEFPAAKALQDDGRRLRRSGMAIKSAAEGAADGDCGHQCYQQIMDSIRKHFARIRAADEKLLGTAFVATMAVAAGQDMDAEALEVDARREVYVAWCKNQVRRRLPRILGKMKDAPCPPRVPTLRRQESWVKRLSRRLSTSSRAADPERVPFGELDEQTQVDIALHFCMDLAVSEVMFAVAEGVKSITQLHRTVRVGSVVPQFMGELERKYNRVLLEAAPLRLQSTKNDDALLSFRHATVHDHLVAERFRLHCQDLDREKCGHGVTASIEERIDRADMFCQRASILSFTKYPALTQWLHEAAEASGPTGIAFLKEIHDKAAIGLNLLRICVLLLFAVLAFVFHSAIKEGDWPVALMWVTYILPWLAEDVVARMDVDDAKVLRLARCWWACATCLFLAACAMRIVRDCEWNKEWAEIEDDLKGHCLAHHLLLFGGFGLPMVLFSLTRYIRFVAAGMLNFRVFRFKNRTEHYGSFALVIVMVLTLLADIIFVSADVWRTPWWLTYSGLQDRWDVSYVLIVDSFLFIILVKGLHGMATRVPVPLPPLDEG